MQLHFQACVAVFYDPVQLRWEYFLSKTRDNICRFSYHISSYLCNNYSIDVFVGNLTFNTTEEQLREKFSFVGPVKNIRILTDKVNQLLLLLIILFIILYYIIYCIIYFSFFLFVFYYYYHCYYYIIIKDTGKTKGFAFVEYFDTNTVIF